MTFKRRVLEVSLALAVASILIPFPYPACAEEQCAPIETFTPLADRFPVFRILQGEKLKRAATTFNDQTGNETDWLSVTIVIRQDGWMFLLMGDQPYTVCTYGVVAPDDVADILTKIDGLSV